MIDEWLKVAYNQELSTRGARELEDILSKFPLTDLRKLASGMPVDDLLKQAYLDSCVAKSAGDSETFLDRFKGTPLFDQAMALEQEELQVDILQQQRDEERRMEGDVWQMRDKIRLKKRLLELEKAKQEAGQAGAPEAPAQGAGAPGDVPAEGVQDSSQGLQGGVAKTGAAAPDEAKQKFAFADTLGRQLARADFEKAAQARTLRDAGEAAGAVMAKIAFDWGGLAKTVGGLAMKNPAATGAALGAAGGAIAGGPGNRLGGALGGAALGGAAGGIGSRMAGGQGFADAAKGFGGSVMSKMQGMMPGAAAGGGAAGAPGLRSLGQRISPSIPLNKTVFQP